MCNVKRQSSLICFSLQCVLFYFSRFLFKVQEHSQENKMGVRNLAMVFGPNILRSGVSELNVKKVLNFVMFQSEST